MYYFVSDLIHHSPEILRFLLNFFSMSIETRVFISEKKLKVAGNEKRVQNFIDFLLINI